MGLLTLVEVSVVWIIESSSITKYPDVWKQPFKMIATVTQWFKATAQQRLPDLCGLVQVEIFF